MVDDLGERLMQAGVITPAQLAILRETPNVSGGAMVREALKLGATEQTMAAFFERRGYGPPIGESQISGRDPSLSERIPRSTVTRLLAMPLHRSSGAILTAMADPSDRAAVAELAHRLDSPIRPLPARVSDVERLITEAYGDGTPSLPPRPVTSSFARPSMDPNPAVDRVQRNSTSPPRGSQLPIPAGVTGMPAPAIPLVTRPGNGTAPVASPATSPAASVGTSPGMAAPVAPPPGPLQTTERDITRPNFGSDVSGSHDQPTPADGTELPRLSAPTQRDLPAATAGSEFQALSGRRNSIPSFGAIAGGPPVPIESSLREIARASDRDAVLRAACHAAATVCRSAVFLARRRDLLIGWEGAGVGISRDAIRNLWLPISGPSVFRDSISRARDYMGPPGSSSIDCVYRAATGSRGGVTLVRPVMLRGKVIALLAVDGLGYDDQGVQRVTTVVNAVIEAFERIILANKAAGRSSEPPIGD